MRDFTKRISKTFLLAFFGWGAVFSHSSRATEVPDQLKGIQISDHAGSQVQIDALHFRDETGQVVPLSEYFRKNRPVILNLAYYQCPNLCTFVINGLLDGMKKLSWTAGQQYEVVTLSIDPRETAALAAKKKENYLASYLASGHRAGADAGWHFLTGDEKDIRALADQVGFSYRWVEEDKQYAHAAGIFVLTPEGKISRTLYGIEFAERQLKLSLLEASNGQIGNPVERFLLFCFHYDQKARKYSVYVSRLMTASCTGTVLVFGGYLVAFWRKQRYAPDTEDRPDRRKDA